MPKRLAAQPEQPLKIGDIYFKCDCRMCGNRLVVVSKSTWHAHAKIRKEMQHSHANIFVAKPKPRKRAQGPKFSQHRRYPPQNPPKQISRRASDAGSVSTDSDHTSTYLVRVHCIALSLSPPLGLPNTEHTRTKDQMRPEHQMHPTDQTRRASR
ncbi:hypothetical protein NM688_g6911 [Phlebia brevispora]|uniref:Uncharacterized protein n=1 Tax=Phlebia brevispora TaxID=194682 RepID=A0ACC1SBH9_9APHY|nr:hypothetical protein NM688_g6911 [Phlebia brevispora]